MRKKILAVVMSVAMAVGMVATGTSAKAAEDVYEWDVLALAGQGSGTTITVKSGNVDWEAGIHASIGGFKGGETYRITVDAESDADRTVLAGPDNYLRGDGIREPLTLELKANTRATVSVEFTMQGQVDADCWLMLGNSGLEVDNQITVYSMKLEQISAVGWIIKNGTDEQVWNAATSTAKTYKEALVDSLYQLDGDAFKLALVEAVKSGVTVDTFVDTYVEKESIPVPTAIGYQVGPATGSNTTWKDIRVVYSLPDESKYEVTEVGVVALNPYFAQDVGTDPDAASLNADKWSGTLNTNLVTGTTDTFYTNVTGLGADYAAETNKLYITMHGNNFGSNFGDFNDGKVASRAYVNVKAADGTIVTLFSNVGFAKLEANG